MPYRVKSVPVSQLVLDPGNPRLNEEQPNQKATQLALATLVKDYLLNIAEDIVANGLDPTTLAAVVRDEAVRRKQYITLEGNRRLLAIKSLETPSLVESVLTPGRRKRLKAASGAYLEDPIKSLQCVIFDTPEEAWYWIELRHTGENAGVGLVRWGSNEQDRFRSRHGGSSTRKPAGQIIDFVDRVTPPDPNANNRILSNVSRLVATPAIREKLGIKIDREVVYSLFPAAEVHKSLNKAVGDFRANRARVADIYHEKDRLKYLKDEFSSSDLPDEATRLSEPVNLNDLPGASVASSDQDQDHSTDGTTGAGATDTPGEDEEPNRRAEQEREEANNPDVDPQTDVSPGTDKGDKDEADEEGDTESDEQYGDRTGARSRARPKADRAVVIPRGLQLYIPNGRINVIHDELRKLPVEIYPNACSVLLRVFVELSVDDYNGRNAVLTEEQRQYLPLAKRMKESASHLRKSGRIDERLEKAVVKVADRTGPLGTSTMTLNQYVHNAYVYPKPSEVLVGWDEVQPLVEKLWER